MHIPKGCRNHKEDSEYKKQIVLWSKPWKSSSFQLIYFAFMNFRVFQGGWHFTHLKKPGMWQGKGRRSKSKGLAVFQMQCIFLLFFSTRNLRGFWHFNSVQNHSSKKCVQLLCQKNTHTCTWTYSWYKYTFQIAVPLTEYLSVFIRCLCVVSFTPF